jgi:hypothetical protein
LTKAWPMDIRESNLLNRSMSDLKSTFSSSGISSSPSSPRGSYPTMYSCMKRWRVGVVHESVFQSSTGMTDCAVHCGWFFA